jgi:DNA-directed RNA polymerase specialized sigma24 family protein
MNYKELEQYLKQLFYKYLNKYKISNEDKKDVIQDCLLKIYLKEKEGVLTGDVENNKNYIFITLRNLVLVKAYPTRTLVQYQETLPDLHISYPRTEQDIDNTILSNELRKVVKSKRFTDDERIIINGLLNGFSYTEMRSQLHYTSDICRYGLSWTKEKIIDELNPKFKYLLEYDKVIYGFKSKKQILKHLKMSPDQFNNYLSLGKTIFPNYKLHVL